VRGGTPFVNLLKDPSNPAIHVNFSYGLEKFFITPIIIRDDKGRGGNKFP
jgi:hypothetical protein